MTKTSRRLLDGIRVIEVGQSIAGPFACCTLCILVLKLLKLSHPKRAIQFVVGVLLRMVHRYGGAVSVAIKKVLRSI